MINCEVKSETSQMSAHEEHKQRYLGSNRLLINATPEGMTLEITASEYSRL
jgi:hypothetical protein